MRRRTVSKDDGITPTMGLVVGSALVMAGVLFWVAVASFPEVDWEPLHRLAFLFFVLPIVGAVLIVMSVITSIRNRAGKSRHPG